MKFSGSQYPVNRMTYVLEREEKDGKVIGRFKKLEHGIAPPWSICLDYAAGQVKGGKKSFRAHLWNGFIISEHVKTEKGYISRFDKKCNEDYEEKIKSLIREALRLSEE